MPFGVTEITPSVTSIPVPTLTTPYRVVEDKGVLYAMDFLLLFLLLALLYL
jgi:hypothetical protein